MAEIERKKSLFEPPPEPPAWVKSRNRHITGTVPQKRAQANVYLTRHFSTNLRELANDADSQIRQDKLRPLKNDRDFALPHKEAVRASSDLKTFHPTLEHYQDSSLNRGLKSMNCRYFVDKDLDRTSTQNKKFSSNCKNGPMLRSFADA